MDSGLAAREFDDLQEAQDHITSFAKRHSFALTKARVIYDKQKPKTVRREDYRCDKGGTQRGEGVTRKSTTRMTDCPFQLRLYRIDPESGRWRLEIFEENHNHPLSKTPSQHAVYRKPNEEETKKIRELAVAGVPPKKIVDLLLKDNPETLVAARDVYNTKTQLRKDQLQGLTPIEALIRDFQFDTENWASRYTTDDNGHVNFLFFANARSIELIQAYPDVILTDATYKSNRYEMPLIHFLGVTCIGTTFSIAFCFVSGETDMSYHAAVAAFKQDVIGDAKIEAFLTDDEKCLKNALTTHFPAVPQLLCLWHVNMNVLTKANNLWRVNNVSEEENKENQEKRKEFMASWKQASYQRKLTVITSFI
jgi:MULE transposase domain/FAR1 DNA-binding domain